MRPRIDNRRFVYYTVHSKSTMEGNVMPRRKFDTTQRGISDTHTDAPIATSICENKLVYAERIRTLRAAANLSQGELAEAMNLGRAAISNWETGVSHS